MPKITLIEEQKRNKSRANIYLDEKFEMGASKYAIKKNGLKEGMEITRDQLTALLLDDEVEKAKGYVVDYLLNKSKKGVRDRLKEKGYQEEVIERVMTFIDTYKIIDDQDFAKRKAHDALHLGKNGKRRIRQTLREKGISEEDMQEALDNISFEDEVEMAIKALRPKRAGYLRKAKNDERLFKSKCYAFLMRKGYVGDVITRTLDYFENEGE